MTPEERDALLQSLLEYHYGCHEDPDAIRNWLERDPVARELWDEVQRSATLLERAARDEGALPRFELPDPHEVDAEEPASTDSDPNIADGDTGQNIADVSPRPVRYRLWLGAAAAAILLVVVPASEWVYRHLHLESLREQALRLVVTGPPGVPDAASARFRVETWDREGTPRAASIGWEALDADGAVLASFVEDSDGALDLEIPARLEGARLLRVSARSGDFVQEADLPLRPDRDGPLVHLSTDKPAYQPGETVFLRAVVLDRLTLKEREGSYRLRILDGKGSEVINLVRPAHEGVIAWSHPLPDDAPGGAYRFEILNSSGEFEVENHEFLVRRYQKPRLRKSIVLDRESYAPGSEGVLDVEVERLDGGIPEGASITATLLVDGSEVSQHESTLDRQGRSTIAFVIPEDVDKGEANLNVRVVDGGVVESIAHPFVIPTGRLDVEFFPEGGELIAGIPNRVYVEIRDPLGRAVSARGKVVSPKQDTLADFETEHQGRGRFVLTPKEGDQLYLVFDEPEASSVLLPPARTEGVALRTRDDVTAKDSPLRTQVVTPHEGPWILGAFCRGILVAQDSFQGSGAHDLSLALPDDIGGVLRLTVFDRDLRPVAERLAMKESSRAIDIEIAADKQELLPGESQRLVVKTRDDQGRPLSASVGLAVIDQAVSNMVSEQRLGIADQAWLASDVDELEDIDDYRAMDGDAPRNTDLLLGTRGWRRFAWSDAETFIAEHGDDARRLLIREGRPQVPLVIDTQEASRRAIVPAVHDRRAARERTQIASLVVVILTGLTTLVLGLRRLARSRGPMALPIALGGVGAAIVLGLATVQFTSRQFEFAAPAAMLADGAAAAPAAGLDLEVEGKIELERLHALGYIDFDNFALGRGGRFDAENDFQREQDEVVAAADVVVADRFLAEEEDPIGVDHRAVFRQRRGGFGNAPTVRRLYAHRHEGQTARSDFQETVYWNANLRTGPDGTAEVTFDVSDSVTAWSVRADAHGSRRVGQSQSVFHSILPFHLDATLPVELTAGDRLDVPIAMVSRQSERAEVQVDVRGPVTLSVPGSHEVALPQGRGRYLASMEITGNGDRALLLLQGHSGRFSDQVVREVPVVPRGFPHHWTRSGNVSDEVTFVVPMPEGVIEGSLQTEIKLYPSPLETLLDGLDGLLRMPGGCFEQASSTNYPNVLTLSYLESAGVSAPSVANRARDLMEPGYELIVSYECPRKGYEWFGGDPGHEALTAYGLLEFADMAKVYDVDQEMVDNTRAWLLDRRDGRGGFQRNDRALDSFGRAPQSVTNAYITYALASTGTDEAELRDELARMRERGLQSDDPYELALIACTFNAVDDNAFAARMRKRLVEFQREDGSLVGTTTSITSSRRLDLAVETTAFAILAWLGDEGSRAPVESAMKFLLEARRGNGTFGATQATIMALKAMTEYAEANRRIANPGSVVVYVNDRVFDRIRFDGGHRGVLRLEGLESTMHPGPNNVRLELSGDNQFPWTFDLSYTSEQPANDPEAPLLLETSLSAPVVEEGQPVSLRVVVTNATDEGLPMGIARLGLPASLEAPNEVLKALVESKAVDRWELRGREVVLYWRDFAPGQVRDIHLDLIAKIPGQTRGAASRVALYYTPDAIHWASPLEIEVKPLR